MRITEVHFSLCPATFQVFYTDDNGDNKYVYGLGMGTCYTCTDYILKRFAMKQKKHTGERREP